MYLTGQPPPSVNMFWRRFAIKDIPLESAERFDVWIRDRWTEKDALMEQYITTGRFPANVPSPPSVTQESFKDLPPHEDFIETEVKLAHWYEIANIYIVLLCFGLAVNTLWKGWANIKSGF